MSQQLFLYFITWDKVSALSGIMQLFTRIWGRSKLSSARELQGRKPVGELGVLVLPIVEGGELVSMYVVEDRELVSMYVVEGGELVCMLWRACSGGLREASAAQREAGRMG